MSTRPRLNTEHIRERWAILWQAAEAREYGDMWFEDLARRYAEPHRHYHNLLHIEECLSAFELTRHVASHPRAVEFSIWFHDAVYDPRRADNEEQSARLADRCLSEGGICGDLRLEVRDLVLATKAHDPSGHVDGPLMVDIDLSILGKPEGRFLEYEGQIRREYDWVPDAQFAAKRAEILVRFLARDRIYTTDWFFDRLEKQARLNLEASVRRLR